MDEYWNLASTVGQTIYINSDLLASSSTDWWALSGTVFSLITAITGVIIARKAYLLSHEEAQANRQHQKLTMRPLLSLTKEQYIGGSSGEAIFKVNLINNGVGPALINRYILKVGEQTIIDIKNKEDWADFDFKKMRLSFANALGLQNVKPTIAVLTTNSSLAINLNRELINLVLSSTNYEQVTNAVRGINIYIEYSNIYNEPMPPVSLIH